ncbi:hypothetical protein AZH43_05045 [Acinetobacter pragensis]|uniref:Uncharacterized protein n=1 Tax=Acinetobacter pragensis TaxID=1806892 RepID=A0A151XX45_9GAMM|nr:hypothetical protein AZH43_05045 [Acinetobacter pragensis]
MLCLSAECAVFKRCWIGKYMIDRRAVLQYSDWIVTPTTGHHAESNGDFQHLSAYMDNASRK